jgi:hypothetical protein
VAPAPGAWCSSFALPKRASRTRPLITVAGRRPRSRAQPEANEIGRITPAAAITEFELPAAASSPTGIAPAADGSVWVRAAQGGPDRAHRPGLRESANARREGGALTRIARTRRRRRPPVGTTFSFALNVQAWVTFTFTEFRTGRRVGHACVPPARRRAHRGRCTRSVTVGKLSFAGHSGANAVVFDGRISSTSRLALGGYTVTIVAKNTVGVASVPAALRFAIAR